MRRTLVLVSCLALLIALAPPSLAAAPTPTGVARQATGPRIGLVTDGSALADRGYGEYAWAGVRAGAKAVHGSADAIVPAANTDAYAWAIGWFVDHGYDVVVTVGFQMGETTLAEARAHARVQFIGIDQYLDTSGAPSNYQRLVFAEKEAGYLAGIVAATLGKTGTIGAVGGMKTVPAVVDYIAGYRDGAASVHPRTNALVAYIDDFSRAGLAETAGRAQVAKGADVVFGVAGAAGLGVFASACDTRTWAIGVDVDQYLQAPTFKGCILTSAEKRVARATSLAIQRFAASGLQAGEYVNDASNGGIGLAPIRNVATPPSLQATLSAALAGLADGSIVP
jgi:basic membrane protein A